MVTTVVNFDIIFERTLEGYQARAQSSLPGAPNPRLSPMRLEQLLGGITLDDLYYAEPGRTPKATNGPNKFTEALIQLRDGWAKLEHVRTAGKGLWQALPDPVQSAFDRACENIGRDASKILRVGLQFDSEDLAMLPWELLEVSGDPNPTTTDYLLADRRHSLIRRTNSGTNLPPPVMGTPLRVLIWAANPPGTERLKFEEEVSRIKKGLQGDPAREVKVDLVVAGGQTEFLDKLKDALDREEGYHVLHFIGHGVYDHELKQGVIEFEPEPGAKGRRVTGEDLSIVLRNIPSIRLVFLNSCETGVGNISNAYAAVGMEFARYMPVVIAMRSLLEDESAVLLAERFYRELASGRESVDESLAWARIAVHSNYGKDQPFGWAIPALFTRSDLVVLPAQQHMQLIGQVAGAASEQRNNEFPPVQPKLLDHELNYADDWKNLFEFIPPVVEPEMDFKKAVPKGPTWGVFRVADMSSKLEESRRLLVLGSGGLGKTTLSWLLAENYWKSGGKFLPLLISLRDWRTDPAQQPLLEYIKHFLRNPAGNYPAGPEVADHLDEYFAPDPNQASRLVFLLDDLNRMPRDDGQYWSRVDAIKQFSADHRQVMLAVFTRTDDYDAEFDQARPVFAVVEATLLQPDRITQYLNNFASDRVLDQLATLATDQCFRSLAQIPYHLYQIVLAVRTARNGGMPWDQVFAMVRDIPKVRQTYIQYLFTAAGRKVPPELQAQVQASLQTLAVELDRNNQRGTFVPYSSALRYLGSPAGATDENLAAATHANILDLDPPALPDQAGGAGRAASASGGPLVGFEYQELEDYFRELAGTNNEGNDPVALAREWDRNGTLDADKCVSRRD